MENLYNTLIKNIGKTIKQSINEAFDFNKLQPLSNEDIMKKTNISVYQGLYIDLLTDKLQNSLSKKIGTDNAPIKKNINVEEYEILRGNTVIITLSINYDNNKYINVTINNYYNAILNTLYELDKDEDLGGIHINLLTINIDNSFNHYSYEFTNMNSLINLDILNININFSNKKADVIPICNIRYNKDNIITEETLYHLKTIIPSPIHFYQFERYNKEQQDLITNIIYNSITDNDDPVNYLKNKKIKFEEKDFQRVEDLIKKQKNCKSMADAIGEKAKSKAGFRYIAFLRLLHIPFLLAENSNDIYQLLKAVASYNDNTYNIIYACEPQRFFIKFIELGGTLEDLRNMYLITFKNNQVEKRNERINNFKGSSTARYGRLKDFVIFLDSLNLPYYVDNITDAALYNNGVQYVKLYDANKNNVIASFGIKADDIERGNGEVDYRYKSWGGYRTVYKGNGNYKMLGQLTIKNVSDSLKPYLSEGNINLTFLRAAIKRFLKNYK